jgi:hypothetical protein
MAGVASPTVCAPLFASRRFRFLPLPVHAIHRRTRLPQTQATFGATGADAPRKECDAAPLQTDPPDGIEKTPAAAIMSPPGTRAPRPQTTRTGLPKGFPTTKTAFPHRREAPTDGKATGGKIRAFDAQQHLWKISGQK